MCVKKLPDPLDQRIGANIRLYREKKGLSQTELGESIGVTYQQIQKYENASNRVAASTLIRFARVLGVSTDALLGE